MKLTGKCKELFTEWFYVNDGIKQSMSQFSDLTLYAFTQSPDSMQYGVYVDFFDSIGIDIGVFQGIGVLYNGCVEVIDKDEIFTVEEKTRAKARLSAIQKANELINNK